MMGQRRICPSDGRAGGKRKGGIEGVRSRGRGEEATRGGGATGAVIRVPGND